ncbi:MAG: hypothetical protein KF914_00170 [Rhizobiaceae bacterium]|nr:hypothetical protein [Rhizobiaceae bacterium]
MGAPSGRSSFDRLRRVYPVESMQPGIDVACRLIASVIGPCGRAVLVGRGPSFPLRSRSGYAVLQQVELAHKPQNAGLSFMRELAWSMQQDFRDGSSAVVLIAAELLRGAGAAVAAGIPAIELAEALQAHGELIVRQLRAEGRAADIGALTAVAEQAAGDDAQTARRLAEAAAKLGPDAFIEIETAESRQDSLVVETGYRIEGGLASSRLAAGFAGAARLDDPLIVVHPAPIESFNAVEPVMRMAAAAGRSLLFLTEGISGEALATLVINRQANRLAAVAARLTAAGETRRALLDDIAAVTGATIIGDASGTRLAELRPAMVGRAGHVMVTAQSALVVGGQGAPETVAARVAAARLDLQRPGTLDLDRERASRRLAYLTSGVVRAQLGAASRLEAAARLEQARSVAAALSAARRGGVVAGGASAWVAAEARARASLAPGTVGAAVGQVFARALSAPLRCIAASSGDDADWVTERVRQSAAGESVCFDAAKRTFRESRALGDPLDVMTAAVSRAVSATATLLTANRLIVRVAT